MLDPWAESWIQATRTDQEKEGSVAVLLEVDPRQALLLSSSGSMPVGLDGPGWLGEAMTRLAAAERDRRRDLDRLHRCERFLVLADLLATARGPADVLESLAEHVPPIVGAWKALVLSRVPEDGRPSGGVVRVVAGDRHAIADVELEASVDLPLPALGLLERDQLPEPEEPLAGIARAFFDRTPAVRIAWAAIRASAILLVADRRRTQTPGPGDWDLLRVVTRQAAAALDRLS